MAGRTNRPLWETSDVDRKPIEIYRPSQTKRTQNSTDAFLPSGAVEYRPDPGPSWRTNGYSTMSGNGSSSTSGTVIGNDRYKSRATSPGAAYDTATSFRSTYGFDYMNGGAPVLPSMSTSTLLAPHFATDFAYNAAFNPVSSPGPSRRPGLQSPFAPIYPPPTVTVAPAELVAGARPMVSPRTSGNAPTNCHCLVCSDDTLAKCFQSKLARQYELLGTVWEEERTRSEQLRLRMESIFREETRITVDHYRGLWDAEKTQLKSEIAYLSDQIRMLGDENLLLKSKLADRVQAGEPIIYHGSFQGNTPLVDGSPPSPMARRQSGGARNSDSARDNRRISGLPGCYSNLFGLGAPASPQMPAPQNPSPLDTSVSPPASAPPALPSTRISMSPPPGQETIPISPTFSPYLSSPSPFPETGTASGGVSTPVRSPKRPISVIDVHELDPKLEGISLRASAVRKTTFEEPPSDGSPPSKRQRSLSHDYYIVTNLQGEDEVTDVKKTEDEEDEERRLTMHAGFTPNHSPSLPPAAALRPSQGSATPTASSVIPESNDPLKTEDHSVTATVKEEVGESSGVSYPDLSNHLRRVDSSSSDSYSQGVLSAASGDAPLKGPLMIKNIPAQDELFLAALNERLEPISQGQDSLPRAVQTPVAVPASLSFDGADVKQTTVPENTDISGTQTEVDEEEHSGVHVKLEHTLPFPPDNDNGQERDVHIEPKQPAYRIRWPADPGYAYDGTSIKAEPSEHPFSISIDSEDLPVQAKAPPTIPVKTEDSDDDSDSRSSEPEISIKFRSTSNFGAPLGKR